MSAEGVHLTGRTRHRTGWRGRLVLQVEETGRTRSPHTLSLGPWWTRWRDARAEDLAALDSYPHPKGS